MRLPPSLTWIMLSALSCTSGSSSSPAPAPIAVASPVNNTAPSDNSAAPIAVAPAPEIGQAPAPAPATAPGPAVAGPKPPTTPQTAPTTQPRTVAFNANFQAFQSNCNSCHGARAPSLSSYSTAEIAQSIGGSSPSMPIGGRMSATDTNAILAYLKTVQQ